MEFGFRLDSELLIVPRGTEYIGTSAGEAKGIHWQTKYGYVGMNQSFASTYVSDGMNEKGLVVGALYFPHFAQYQEPDSSRIEQTLGSWEVPSYLLATCASVDEAKRALDSLLVAQEPVPNPIPGMKDFVLPLHYYISDAQGNILVVEYIKGQRKEYNNPLGVLTNSPSFEWHLTNLSNYVNLSPENVSSLALSHGTVRGFGQGTGLLGIPGDYTPPSRFVRAVLFTSWVKEPKNASDAVRTGFHLLNAFDIAEGVIRPRKGSPLKEEITEWVVIHDQTHTKTFFRGYDSLKIQMVDLSQLDFTQPGLQTISISKNFFAQDVTKTTKPFAAK